MNILAIDAGNTAIKLGFFSEGVLQAIHIYFAEPDQDLLHRLIRRHKVTNAIVSTVGKPLIEIQSSITDFVKPFIVRPTTPVPIKTMYRKRVLGTDRLAMAVYAAHAFPEKNVLIVSAGTCITYDFINSEGVHLGGTISPGIYMRLQALHDYTAKLPEVKLNNSTPVTGTDTNEAMISGAVMGAAFEIAGFIDYYRQNFDDLHVILTGGDHERLLPHLKFKIFARPNAVLEGLHLILLFNVDSN